MAAAIEALATDDLRYQAASLAFAMLRFADGAAHVAKYSTPPGVPRTGIECYIFAPSWRHILNADVPRFLAELSSPAILSSSTTRGVATLMLLDELQGERRQWGQKTIDNQREGLASMSKQLELDDQSRVLLQFDDEEHWLPMPVVDHWCANFAVNVGWNMRSYVDDDRARARLMLFRSDGEMSWGNACPKRYPDDPSSAPA
jgi:hypothetical protein